MHVVAGGTVASGDVVKTGSVVGVAINGGGSGDTISVAVCGVYSVKKKTTDVVAQGTALYWDAGNSEMTVTSTSNTLAGYAWEAAGNGVTSVNIRLLF